MATSKIKKPAKEKKLKVGDTVLWSGSCGTESPKEAKVTAIERTAQGSKYGREVKSVSWTSTFVVTLDNEHWAYGHQLKPLN